MWQDEKVEAKSARNSTNRRSERGGYGIAIHNTGATSFETRKEEMVNYFYCAISILGNYNCQLILFFWKIIENEGEEPDMLAFLEDAHRNRKSGDINDKKVKKIVETVKEKIHEQLTQGGATETNHLTQAEINTLVLKVSHSLFSLLSFFSVYHYVSFYRKLL